MRIYLRSSAFAALLVLATPPSMAVDTLFRGDSRPPDTIFRDGFRGGGQNFNVFDHVSGWSCFSDSPLRERSAYVSLSDNDSDARMYGEYVYRIVPDADAPSGHVAIDVMSGMADMVENWGTYGFSLGQRSTASRMRENFATPGQYVSTYIPPQLIQSVDQYALDPATQAPTLIRTVPNPDFRMPARRGTQARFPDAMITATREDPPPPSLSYAVSGNGTTAPACAMPAWFGGCANDSRSLPRSTHAGNWQCVVEPMLGPSSPFHQALQLILQ